MVVSIIAVLAALAGPSVAAAIREMRASSARADLVRILNHARSAARGTGKAHLLEFDPTGDANRGRLAVYRANGSSCVTTNWAPILAASGNCTTRTPPNQGCLARSELRGGFELASFGLQVTEAMNSPLLYLCYEPAGRTFWSSQVDATGLSSTPPPAANGAFIFTLRTFRGGTGGAPVGVARQILQPYGAAARVRQ